MGGCNRLAHLLKVGDDHRDQVLLVLQKGVKHFCHRNFRLILVAWCFNWLFLSSGSLRINLLVLKKVELAQMLACFVYKVLHQIHVVAMVILHLWMFTYALPLHHLIRVVSQHWRHVLVASQLLWRVEIDHWPTSIVWRKIEFSNNRIRQLFVSLANLSAVINLLVNILRLSRHIWPLLKVLGRFLAYVLVECLEDDLLSVVFGSRCRRSLVRSIQNRNLL